MSFTLSLALLLLLSYLIGSIPFGYLIGRCHGLDIRKEGSGNIGATNVTRVIGPWWGKLCFLLDFLKGLLPAGSAVLLTGNGVLEDPYHLLPAAATLAVVLGHIYPVFLKFRGGKGMSGCGGARFSLLGGGFSDDALCLACEHYGGCGASGGGDDSVCLSPSRSDAFPSFGSPVYSAGNSGDSQASFQYQTSAERNRKPL